MIMVYNKLYISDGSSSLKVLFNFSCVLVVEASRLAVELHVTLIDVIDISVMLELPPSAVL